MMEDKVDNQNDPSIGSTPPSTPPGPLPSSTTSVVPGNSTSSNNHPSLARPSIQDIGSAASRGFLFDSNSNPPPNNSNKGRTRMLMMRRRNSEDSLFDVVKKSGTVREKKAMKEEDMLIQPKRRLSIDSNRPPRVVDEEAGLQKFKEEIMINDPFKRGSLMKVMDPPKKLSASGPPPPSEDEEEEIIPQGPEVAYQEADNAIQMGNFQASSQEEKPEEEEDREEIIQEDEKKSNPSISREIPMGHYHPNSGNSSKTHFPLLDQRQREYQNFNEIPNIPQMGPSAAEIQADLDANEELEEGSIDPKPKPDLLVEEEPVTPTNTPIAEPTVSNPTVGKQSLIKDGSMPVQVPTENHISEEIVEPSDAPPIYDPRQRSVRALDHVGPSEEQAERSVPNDDRKSDKDDASVVECVTKKKPSSAPIDHNIHVYPLGLEDKVNLRVGCTLAGCGLLCFLIGISGGSIAWASLVLACGIWSLMDMARIDREAIDHQMDRHVALRKMISKEGETAEWLNSSIDHIWRTLDPTPLASLVDVVEDALNAAMPSVVQAAHVQDLELGTQAPRITSINLFPRTTEDPSDELFGEISFDLHAYPSSSRPKLVPPHVLIHLLVGVKGVGATTLPVKAQLLGMGGKARFRLRTTSKGPFLKHLDFAFTRIPKFDAAVFPLGSLNLMSLPVLSHYVKSSIDLALQEFVEPRYFPLDLESILSGDDQRHDTNAIGVLRIHLKSASGLKSADLGSDNDAYITCNIEHGKVLCATRIITSKTPQWDETHFVPVTQTSVENDLDLIVKVWDSDRLDKDDLLGQVRFRLRDIVELDGGLVFDGDADLSKQHEATKHNFKGLLSMTMEYCPKFTGPPPNESCPAMLGCLIYQASGIEVVQDAYLNKSTKTPDPYAVLYINQSPSFITRTKLNNPAPYWNAASEHFVRDWRSATATVVVKTRLAHEHDPVVGVANIDLGGIFKDWDGKKVLEHTQWYPLSGGVGFGQVRFGFVIKPIQMQLPPNLVGNSVGTLVVDNLSVTSSHQVNNKDNFYIHASLETSSHHQSTQSSANSAYKMEWEDDQLLFPIEDRHQNTITISLKQKTLLTSDKILDKFSMRLNELIDAKVQHFTFTLEDKDLVKSRNSKVVPLSGNDENLTLSFRAGFFPGFSYAHRDHFNSQLVALDPKAVVSKSNLVWSIPGDDDDENRVTTILSNTSDTTSIDSTSLNLQKTNNSQPHDGDILIVQDQEGNLRNNSTINTTPKIIKSSTLRSLRWGKDKLQQKVMDLTSRTKSMNHRPTIEREG